MGFPPFETSTFGGQLLWLTITFVLLYVLMSRLVLPRLSGIIESRRETIARDLDDAAAMKIKAEEAGEAYEKALAEAKSRAQGLAQETRSALAAETETSRKGLEARAFRAARGGRGDHRREEGRRHEPCARDRGRRRDRDRRAITGKAPSPQVVAAALDSSKA